MLLFKIRKFFCPWILNAREKHYTSKDKQTDEKIPRTHRHRYWMP